MRKCFAVIGIFMWALSSAIAVAKDSAPPTVYTGGAINEGGSPTVTIKGKTYYKGFKKAPKRLTGVRYIQYPTKFVAALPDHYDSRDHQLVPDIRNQGGCGSCWDFSRTAALEAAAIIAGKADKSINLAEQDTLLNDSDDSGCGGGYMQFNYEIKHGVTSEDKCPYTASDSGRCTAAPVVQGLKMAFLGDANNGPKPDDLRAGIFANGIVSVTTAAGGSFDTDSKGNFVGCRDSGVNHMVNLVGWDKQADGSYKFLMRNSWGTGWGLAGYGWLTQGCEETAVGSQSAMVVWVDGPGPIPQINLMLPIEIIIHAGQELPLEVSDPGAGWSLKWSTGETGLGIWVKPAVDTVYMVTATNASGATVQATTSVLVKP